MWTPASSIVSRPIHGVFTGDPIAITDEAWAIAKQGDAVAVREGNTAVYYVNMKRDIGYVGGQAGALGGNPSVQYIRLVIEGNSNLITSFPVSGIPTR